MSTENARKNMVYNQVRPNRVYHAALLDALLETPRENFLPAHLQSIAYCDQDLPYHPGRYLMAPMIFAQLLESAEIEPHHRVLVVGCGAGYSLAILSKMAKSVVGLESIAELANLAERHVTSLNLLNIALVTGPLDAGHIKGEPYDHIIIEGAVETIPDSLFEQLSHQGRLTTIVRTSKNPHLLGQGTVFIKDDQQIKTLSKFEASSQCLSDFTQTETFTF